jgi:hypothetical protein
MSQLMLRSFATRAYHDTSLSGRTDLDTLALGLGPHASQALWPVVIFHKVPNMSREMFIKKKAFSVDGFLENELVFGRVKFILAMI